ncbi:MAG: hypothetical protein ACOCP4_01380 [Candidatus Woesearchaeota archaeon]
MVNLKEKEKEKVMEKIVRWQLLAEQWKKEDIGVFIKTINNDIHFCKIESITETKIYIKNYGPVHRKGTFSEIYWIEIDNFTKDRSYDRSYDGNYDRSYDGNYDGKYKSFVKNEKNNDIININCDKKSSKKVKDK